MRATDRPRLLITSAPASAAHPRQLGREKHDMPHLCSLFGGRSDSANADGRCRRGLDQGRDDDHEGRVQHRRRRELSERTHPPMRQPRRARRERVEMKHDERFARRVPKEPPPRLQPTRRSLPSPCPILAAIASPGPLATMGTCGNFPDVSQNLTPRSSNQWLTGHSEAHIRVLAVWRFLRRCAGGWYRYQVCCGVGGRPLGQLQMTTFRSAGLQPH